MLFRNDGYLRLYPIDTPQSSFCRVRFISITLSTLIWLFYIHVPNAKIRPCLPFPWWLPFSLPLVPSQGPWNRNFWFNLFARSDLLFSVYIPTILKVQLYLCQEILFNVFKIPILTSKIFHLLKGQDIEFQIWMISRIIICGVMDESEVLHLNL